MAARRSTPRSVADATRFTASTPHANTKSSPSPASASASSPSASPKQPLPRSSGHRPQQRRGGGQPPSPSPSPSPSQQVPQPQPQPAAESIEERVRRLRAAHLAAKQHDVSRFDRVVNASRKYFDAAHKLTVMGLIGFSGLALFVTVYATADMMMYNRKRRGEFFAVQQQLRDDSLEAARLAYMTGTASEDQVAMVEEATARAQRAGVALPSLLSAPLPAAEAVVESSSLPSSSAGELRGEAGEKKKNGGLTGWLFGGLKTGGEGEGEDGGGALSFSREEAAARAATPGGGGGGGESQNGLRDRAKAAFDQERENQRKGGPLDQVGLDAAAAGNNSGEAKKKGWLW